MPIYEFSCPECKDRFEKLCRQDAGNEVRCPDCGTAAKKVFSTFNSRSSSGGGGSGGSSCGSCKSTNCGSC